MLGKSQWYILVNILRQPLLFPCQASLDDDLIQTNDLFLLVTETFFANSLW
jgi:hypothetical protein